MARPSSSHPSQGSVVPHLQVLAAAVLFSTGGVAVKASSLSAWQVASFRAAVAVAAVAVYLVVRSLRERRSGEPGAGGPPVLARVASRLARPSLWMVGLAYAATLILYVAANKQTTAASAIFLQSTAPLYVLLLSPWLLGESTRRRDLVYMAVLAAGMALFFLSMDPVSATAPNPAAGNVLGGLAGFTWALTLLGLRWLGREPTVSRGAPAAPRDPSPRNKAPLRQSRGVGLEAVLVGNILAFLLPLPWALQGGSGGEGGWVDWAVVLYLGLFQVAGAYLFLTAGLRGVSALEASLLLLIDPVLSPIWAWLAHGEPVGLGTVVGGGVILTATAVKAWLDSRRAGRRRKIPAEEAA